MNKIFLIIGISFLLVGSILTAAVFSSLPPSFINLFPSIFIVLGAVLLILPIRSIMKQKKLRKTGRKVCAEIVDAVPNTSVTINGRNPYIIHCAYGDMRFQGDYDKTSAVNLIGRAVPVYISRENPEEYFVDCSEL